jgi:hypothetical protein
LPWDDSLAQGAATLLQAAQGLGPILGVGATAALAALDYLEQQFPHVRMLQSRPALLVGLAHGEYSRLSERQGEITPLISQLTPLIGQLAPLVEHYADRLPGLLDAVRASVGALPVAIPSGAQPPGDEVSPPTGPPVQPAEATSGAPGQAGGLRFVQR